MKHYFTLPFVTLGFLMVVGGLAYYVEFTGFPYVQAIRETAADYARHARTVSVICWLGIGVILYCSLANSNDRARQVAADFLGVITASCALWQLRNCAYHYWWWAYDWKNYFSFQGPPFEPGILFFTLPPTLVCTLTALVLVGPRKCKLAWISVCTFVVPVAETVWMFFRWPEYFYVA